MPTLTVGANGQYATIQSAINASANGDTIQVASGTYAENLNINKSVTIDGANVGVSGDATRGAESNIAGTIAITAANVTLDGVEVSTPTGSGTGIDVQSAANATVKNSVLVDAAADNGNANGVQTNATGLTFTGNKVSAYSAGLYVNGGATGDISGNTFAGNGSGAVLDTSQVKFHGNTLSGSLGADVATDAGTGFASTDAAGDDNASTYIYNNTYSQRATPGDRAISINPEQNGITVTGTDGNDRLRDDFGHTGIKFIGGSGSDSINASFADLNTDTFQDIAGGEAITVNDKSGVTATLTNGQLFLRSGTATSVVNVPGAADGAVTVSSDTSAKTTTITYNGSSTGDDNPTGTSGNDTATLGTGNDTYNGGAGSDLIYGNQGDDMITGTAGNDTSYGGQGNDTINYSGSPDASVIYGNKGNDSLSGGSGADKLYGGQDNDRVAAGAGSDMVYGNMGNDVVYGNAGDDKVYGGQGSDSVYGGQGNDVLFGNKGDDLLVGGLGSDTFGFNAGDTDFKSGVSTGDTISDFVTGTDKIDFTQGPAATAQNFGAASTTSTDFASIQATAQGLINGGDAYAFVSDGTDGFLFTTGGNGTTIADAVKLTGASTVASLKASDISHGATIA